MGKISIALRSKNSSASPQPTHIYDNTSNIIVTHLWDNKDINQYVCDPVKKNWLIWLIWSKNWCTPKDHMHSPMLLDSNRLNFHYLYSLYRMFLRSFYVKIKMPYFSSCPAWLHNLMQLIYNCSLNLLLFGFWRDNVWLTRPHVVETGLCGLFFVVGYFYPSCISWGILVTIGTK